MRMLIVAGGHTVSSTGHGEKKKKKKEVGFSLLGGKNNRSEIRIRISIS